MKLIAAAMTVTALALAAPAMATESADEQKSKSVQPPAERGAPSSADPSKESAGTGAASGEAGDDDPTPGDKSRVEGYTRQQKGL